MPRHSAPDHSTNPPGTPWPARTQRGHLDRAVATLAEAIRLIPEDLELRRHLGVALLASGDRAGRRCSNATLLDRFGQTISPWTANKVALACTLAPEAPVDPRMAVRLAEARVKGADERLKADASRTLGVALYRDSRFNEAIRQLDEATQLWGGAGQPVDWGFLAMAHRRLGRRADAVRWLDRLRDHQPSAAPARFWDELEVRLLRSEAEALILYDPIFPDDPFAK
jgi:Flp pilus assembly protein TadD